MTKARRQALFLKLNFAGGGDYLEGKKARDEYVDGQIYEMTGGSANHNQLTLSLAAKLYAHLADCACRVFASDMKVTDASGNQLLPRCGGLLRSH